MRVDVVVKCESIMSCNFISFYDHRRIIIIIWAWECMCVECRYCWDLLNVSFNLKSELNWWVFASTMVDVCLHKKRSRGRLGRFSFSLSLSLFLVIPPEGRKGFCIKIDRCTSVILASSRERDREREKKTELERKVC